MRAYLERRPRRDKSKRCAGASLPAPSKNVAMRRSALSLEAPSAVAEPASEQTATLWQASGGGGNGKPALTCTQPGSSQPEGCCNGEAATGRRPAASGKVCEFSFYPPSLRSFQND